jgi:hypothetical protein
MRALTARSDGAMQQCVRTAILAIAALIAAGCASKEAPPAESPSTAQSSNDPNRKLTKSECDSLGASIVDACNNRGNDRSSEADGWCSDMVRRNESNEGDRSWVASDCLPHFKYMDSFCFNGARNAHAMMTCDRTVDRTQ